MSEESLFRRGKIFSKIYSGGMETQTSSVTDEYLRDAVCEAIWNRNTVTLYVCLCVRVCVCMYVYMYTYVYVYVYIFMYIYISYMHIYVYIFTLLIF